MEHKFLSGVSIFDFLAMIIPGGIIIAIIGKCIGYEPFTIIVFDDYKFSIYLILFISAYFVGLIHNLIIDWIFNKWFRNNIYCIYYYYLKAKRIKIGLWTLFVNDIYYNRCKHNSSKLLSIIKKLTKICHNKCKIEIRQKLNKDIVLKEYYHAYYYVACHPINTSISIMECQVTFIRNMLFPIIGIFVFCNPILIMQMNVPKINTWFFILLFILLFITMCSRQNKIYKRVWEDYTYLNILQEKKYDYTNHIKNTFNPYIMDKQKICK